MVGVWKKELEVLPLKIEHADFFIVLEILYLVDFARWLVLIVISSVEPYWDFSQIVAVLKTNLCHNISFC